LGSSVLSSKRSDSSEATTDLRSDMDALLLTESPRGESSEFLPSDLIFRENCAFCCYEEKHLYLSTSKQLNKIVKRLCILSLIEAISF